VHIHSSDQQAIAEAFNNHFSSIVDSVNNKNAYNETRINEEIFATPYNYLLLNCVNLFPSVVFKPFSAKEITNIITFLKSKNTLGYGEHPTKLLKINASYICSPLTYICNKSVLSGIFSDHLNFLL
jgi:hypothetical protein